MRVSSDDPKLSAYHDEMLDARGMRQIKGILRTQPDLGQQYSSLTRTVANLRRLGDPEPPPDFWPDTYRRLRDYATSGQCRRPVCRTVRAALLGLLMVALLGGAVAYARGRGHTAGVLTQARSR